MSAYMGRWGKVYTGSSSAYVAYIDSWSMSNSIGTADVSAYGNTARAYTQTLRDASLTFNATMDRSDTNQADLFDQFEDGTLAAKTVRLYPGNGSSSTEFWAGQILLTGQTVNSAVGDKTSVTWNAQFTGGVQYYTTGATA